MINQNSPEKIPSFDDAIADEQLYLRIDIPSVAETFVRVQYEAILSATSPLFKIAFPSNYLIMSISTSNVLQHTIERNQEQAIISHVFTKNKKLENEMRDRQPTQG